MTSTPDGKDKERGLRMDKPYINTIDGEIMYLDKLPHLWPKIEGHKLPEVEENNQPDDQSSNNEIPS